MIPINPDTVNAREGLAVGLYAVYSIAQVESLQRALAEANERAALHISTLEARLGAYNTTQSKDADAMAECYLDARTKIAKLEAENSSLRERAEKAENLCQKQNETIAAVEDLCAEACPNSEEMELPQWVSQVVSESNKWMLDSIRASLREYPNMGGDIEVMREVDRIKEEAVAKLEAKNARLREALTSIKHIRDHYVMVSETTAKACQIAEEALATTERKEGKDV